MVDTLALERHWLFQRRRVVRTGGMRLASLHHEYHLPRYPAHNALSDAVAVAELFIAQVEHHTGGRPMKLRRLLC